MAQDVYQRKAGEVRAVGPADHDGVAAQVRGQRQGLPAFGVAGIVDDTRQMLDHQAERLAAHLLHQRIVTLAGRAVEDFERV